jgi:hypothetical protein
MTRETVKNPSLGTENTHAELRAGSAPAAQVPARHAIIDWLFPSLEGIVFIAVLLGVMLLDQTGILSNGETALHLRLGSDMLNHGSLLQTDTLTRAGYGQPLVTWEWLSELLFAGLWRLFGLNGLLLLAGCITALTASWLLRAMRKRGVPVLLALPLALAALGLTSSDWQALPALFSLPLTLWWSEQLWSYWQSGNSRKLWPFPFVLALWANLDASFIIGLVLLITALLLAWVFPNAASARNIATRQWQLIRVVFACLLATLLTPWPLATLSHSTDFFSGNSLLNSVQEGGMPAVQPLYGDLFLALMLLLGACGVLRGWLAGGRAVHPADLHVQQEQRILAQLATREPGALGWAMAAVFTTLAFLVPRTLPLWGMVVVPIMGRELTCWFAEWAVAEIHGQLPRACRALFRRSWKLEVLNGRLHATWWSGLAIIVLLILLLNRGRLPGTQTPLVNAQFAPGAFPVEAVQTIQRGTISGNALPNGTGFTVIAWADYVEWELPDHVIMVDSRTHLYDASVLDDYQTLLNGEPGWNKVISIYGIHWLLIPPTIPLAQLVTVDQSWLCQDADPHHVALLCTPAPALPVT